MDSSLFEELLLKDPDDEVISWLGFVYGKEVTKKVQDLLRDSTPFQMTTSVSLCLYFMFSSFFFLLKTIILDEHFRHLHGEILQRLTTPAQLPISHKGGCSGDVKQGSR